MPQDKITESVAEKTAIELLETAKLVAQQLLLHADGKDLDVIRDEISKSINKNVNGKIDAVHEMLERQNEVIDTHHTEQVESVSLIRKEICTHNKKHEDDMVKILPVIQAYEISQSALRDAKATGKFVLWIAGFIVAVGSAILMIKSIIK